MRSITVVQLACLLFGIAACSTTTSMHRTGGSGGNAVTADACFDVREVRGYTALNDRYVYVECKGDEHYLLTLSRICQDLRSAIGIAIASDFSRVCSGTRASISYRTFDRLERCEILRVEAVKDKEAAEAVPESRPRADRNEPDE